MRCASERREEFAQAGGFVLDPVGRVEDEEAGADHPVALTGGRKADFVAQRVGMCLAEGAQHLAVRRVRKDRIPQHDDSDIPLAMKRCDLCRDQIIVGFDLVTWVDQQQAAARGGGTDGLCHFKAILLITLGFWNGIVECGVFLRVQFRKVQTVHRAQDLRRDQRRAGIGIFPMI